MTSEQPAQNRIKELRNSSGLSQSKLAKLLSISDTALQNYEYRKRKIPGDVLLRIAECFNVSTDYVMMLTDEPSRTAYSVVSLDYREELSDDEKELVDIYRKVEQRDRELILNHAKMVRSHARK